MEKNVLLRHEADKCVYLQGAHTLNVLVRGQYMATAPPAVGQTLFTMGASLLHYLPIMMQSLPYTDLFLDFDDTLYDTRGNATLALQQLYERHGLSAYYPEFSTFSEIYWRINDELWHAFAHDEISKEELIVERFRRPLEQAGQGRVSDEQCLLLSEDFFALNADKPGTIVGAHDLLDYLAERGYRLHLCSNGFGEVQYRKLAASGMEGRFDTVVLSEDAGANKPSEQYFRYAFDRTGAVPESTLMIGDNPATDIVGAQRMGMDTLWFNERGREAELDTAPTYEVGVLEEIRNIL